MTRRALPLAVVVCLLLAGCSAGGPTETGSPTTDVDPTTTAASTQPDCESIDYEQRELPDRPDNVTEESAVAFAEAYENATVWNEHAADADNSLYVNTRAEIVNRTDTGFVVYVTGGGTYTTCHGEAQAVADMYLHANYFVNETTAVRLEYPGNVTDDPRRHGGEPVETQSETNPKISPPTRESVR